MQRVTPDIGTAFQPVEDALSGTFLPTLFKLDTYQNPRRVVTGMSFDKAGIDLPDPT